MTNGVRVIWTDTNEKIHEVEYFCGIDVDNLARIPPICTVRADWPRYEAEPSVQYHVVTTTQPMGDGTVHLLADYLEDNNLDLAHRYPCIEWGTTTIILKEGEHEGRCVWPTLIPEQHGTVHWEAFDLGESNKRPLAKYLRTRRHAQFRNVILQCDDHRCVLTAEDTPHALEAAHLIPAKDGENDLPFNGIALRADLHRLFDAGLFTFGRNGKVKRIAPRSALSDDYRHLLQNRRLPVATLERVRATLSLPQFQDRKCAKVRPRRNS